MTFWLVTINPPHWRARLVAKKQISSYRAGKRTVKATNKCLWLVKSVAFPFLCFCWWATELFFLTFEKFYSQLLMEPVWIQTVWFCRQRNMFIHDCLKIGQVFRPWRCGCSIPLRNIIFQYSNMEYSSHFSTGLIWHWILIPSGNRGFVSQLSHWL